MIDDDPPPPYLLNPNVTVTQAVPLHGEAIHSYAGSAIFSASATPLESLPGLLLAAVVIPGEKTPEGLIIEATAEPWFVIMEWIRRDPDAIYQFDWRKWEEIIAGAYNQTYPGAKVTLTPRSRDKGRDVIVTVTLPGIGTVRYVDNVKRYKPGHRVDVGEVREMLGVVLGETKNSKGIITTTSTFAPGVMTDEIIKPLIPTRIELRPREVLPWLAEIAAKRSGTK
jgi:restriction system protein